MNSHFVAMWVSDEDDNEDEGEPWVPPAFVSVHGKEVLQESFHIRVRLRSSHAIWTNKMAFAGAHRLQTGMSGAFGNPRHSGQVIMSIHIKVTCMQSKEHVIEST